MFSIILYKDTKSNIDFSILCEFLKKILPEINFEVIGNFFPHFITKINKEEIDNLSYNFAKYRVLNPEKRFFSKPLNLAIEYEKRRLTDKNFKGFGIIYDGIFYQFLCSKLISKDQNLFSKIHIIITDQIFATFNDDRYHLRASIYGFPSIISVNGIIQAPAKDREYYIFGFTEKDYLKENDERLTEVIKGYVLQAIFFHFIGEAFCNDIKCRLYNSHWQSEIIESQIKNNQILCKKHMEILNKIKEIAKNKT